MQKILFVCTGNTCRSPMAAALFQQLAAEQGVAVEVRSAGLYAAEGASLSRHAAQVLADCDLPTDHSSQPVRAEVLTWADAIFTMTIQQYYQLCTFTESAEKVHLLAAYQSPQLREDSGAWQEPAILDPFGGSVADYEACRQNLHNALLGVLEAWEDIFPVAQPGQEGSE